MTTRKPKGSSTRAKPASKAKKGAAKTTRVARAKPARTAPDRSGKTSKKLAADRAHAAAPKAASSPVSAKNPPKAAKAAGEAAKPNYPPPDPGAPGAHKDPPRRETAQTAIDEAVAQAVKSGYDVLQQTIAQGRHAAEHFRQGEYNFRDVPGDVQNVALRMLDLARQLSVTTIDLCEQLVRQIPTTGGPPPPGEVAAQNPAFRKLEPAEQGGSAPPSSAAPPVGANLPPGATAPPSSAAPPPIEGGMQQLRPADPFLPGTGGLLRLSPVFDGTKKAKLLSESLLRPSKPTGVWQISSQALTRSEGDAPALSQIEFEHDLSHGGLIVKISVPKGQPPGTYSGLVLAEGQGMPLGALVVVIEK